MMGVGKMSSRGTFLWFLMHQIGLCNGCARLVFRLFLGSVQNRKF